MHLLDDGFQHRGLARDFDIALITEQDLQDSMLPIGRLREPLSSLSRASAIVVMDDVAAERIPLRPGQYLWRVSRRIVPPQTNDVCFAFCGIARPQNFFTDLRTAGVHLAGTREFRDHHAYGAADVQLLLRLRKQSGATAFVTTEKDAVNLFGFLPQLDPLHIVPVRMQFEPSSGAASRGGGIGRVTRRSALQLPRAPNQGRVRE